MKFFSRLITASLLISMLSALPARASTFSDVPSGYLHEDAIEALFNQKLLKGYPDGTFRPDNPVTRAELVKVLVSATQEPAVIQNALAFHQSQGHTFVDFYDIGIADWAAPYVDVAYQNGVVKGYADGNFKPQSDVNFAEALKIILGSFNVSTAGAAFKENPLLYVKQDDWFAPYFMTAAQKNLLNARKFYHPSQLMTRAEVAEIVFRLISLKNTGAATYIVTHTPSSDQYTITIPRLNIINVPVSFADPYNESNALSVLKEGFGHYLAPPDSGKKMVLFGHSSGYSWDHSAYKTILKTIDQLQPNDPIYINYKEKGYEYTVNNSEIIPAKNADALMQDPEKQELALYTCWPPNRIDYRYVIYGRPVF